MARPAASRPRLVADEVPVAFDLLTGTAGPEENSLTVEGDEGRLSLVEWYRLVADRHTDTGRTVVDERADTTTLLLDELVAALDGDGAGEDLVGFDEAAAVAETVETVLSEVEATATPPGR